MDSESESSSRRRRRGRFPMSALFLIALGVLLLLQTTGVLPWEVWSSIWRLWPVVIIAIGINIVVGRRAPWLAGALVTIILVGAVGLALWFVPVTENVVVNLAQEPLNGVEKVEAHIGFGAGTLSVNSLDANSPSLFEGEFRGRGAETSVERSGNAADLDISMGDFGLQFFRNPTNAEWELSLSTTPSLRLNIDRGGSDMNLDLRNLKVNELDINIGASDTQIVMPESAGLVEADISAGAASVIITIPDGVAARIDADSAVGLLTVDGTRFPRKGDVYESSDFQTAQNRIDLDIDSGASSVEVR